MSKFNGAGQIHFIIESTFLMYEFYASRSKRGLTVRVVDAIGRSGVDRAASGIRRTG